MAEFLVQVEMNSRTRRSAVKSRVRTRPGNGLREVNGVGVVGILRLGI